MNGQPLRNVVPIHEQGQEKEEVSACIRDSGFYTELKRRNVLRASAAYIVGSWLVAQVADLLCDGFAAPAWVMRAILITLVIGFPIAVIISWYFEFTATLKWEADTASIEKIARQKGRRMDFLIILILTILISVLLAREPEGGEQTGLACFMGEDTDPSGDPPEKSVQTRRPESDNADSEPSRE